MGKEKKEGRVLDKKKRLMSMEERGREKGEREGRGKGRKGRREKEVWNVKE